MSAPILIIAHATDAGATLVAAEVCRRVGPESVQLLRPETLGVSRWSHKLDARGVASTRIDLPSGLPIAGGAVRAVLNRIQSLPVTRFRRAARKDHDYAAAELQALVASWLAEMSDRVVPSARSHPTLNATIPALQWAHAAAGAGLPVCSMEEMGALSPLEQAGRSVLVAGVETGGALAEKYGRACRIAADSLGAPVLQFYFAECGGAPVLVDATPLPPLTEPWAAAMTAHLLTSIAERCSP